MEASDGPGGLERPGRRLQVDSRSMMAAMEKFVAVTAVTVTRYSLYTSLVVITFGS